MPLVVQLVRYRPSALVAIKRGENAGRTIEYTQYRHRHGARVGMWNGAGDLALEVPAPGSDAVVVILQDGGPGDDLCGVAVEVRRCGVRSAVTRLQSFPAAVDPEPLTGMGADLRLQRVVQGLGHLGGRAVRDGRLDRKSKCSPSGWRMP